jgi:predicted porin
MKKTLVALAALAAATGAFAQSPNARAIDASGVTIFGVADIAINQLAIDGVVSSLNRLEGSGRNESSRLGFRGMEDMGGGWAAGFWLEAGMTVDDGAGGNTTINNTAVGDKIQLTTSSAAYTPNGVSLTGRQGLSFNRASTVSLINKGFGEIRLGRDYTTSFWNQTGFDPFGTVGVGAATNVTLGALSLNSQISSNPVPSVRTSNAISWLSNDMAGFRAQLQYAFSEVPAGCDGTNMGNVINSTTTTYCPGQNGDGRTIGMRLRYNNGPLDAAVGYAKTNYGDYNTILAGNLVQGIALGKTTPSTTEAVATVANTANTALAPYLGNLTHMNIAASFQVTSATKIMGQWGQQNQADTPINNAAVAAQGATIIVPAASATTANSATTISTGRQYTYQLLGVTHATGPWTLKASYVTGSRSETNGTKYTGAITGTAASTATKGEDGGKQSQIALGAVYDLSKRTALYGTYSQLKLTAGGSTAGSLRNNMGLTGSALAANGQATATGIDLGIRHRF